MKPGDYVVLYDANERSGPTPQACGLDHFKTVAFDACIMKQFISFDRARGTIDAGLWIDGVVPECYRARVRGLAEDVFDHEFRGRVYKPDTLDMYVHALRITIWRELEPTDP